MGNGEVVAFTTTSPTSTIEEGRMQLQLDRRAQLGWRAAITGLLAAAGAALLIGIPTAVIPNPYFSRMTEVRTQDYILLAGTALLMGLVASSYAVSVPPSEGATGKLVTGGLLSFLAVGCPICNKVALLLLGTGGALTYWAPLQPVLGILSVALLGLTLGLRVRALRSVCTTCVRSDQRG